MKYVTKIKTAVASALCVMVGMAYAETETYDVQLYGATFESAEAGIANDHNYVVGTGIGTYAANGVGWFAGSEDDVSAISNRLDSAGGQMLYLNTEGSMLTNVLASSVTTTVNSALAGGSVDAVTSYDSAYVEAEVKFVGDSEFNPGFIGGETAAKFAIYGYYNGDVEGSPTNLVVYHGYVVNDAIAYTNEVFPVVLDPAAYTRVRVNMKKASVLGSDHNVFSVSINGAAPLTSDTAASGSTWFITTEGTSASATLSSVAFTGSGEVDNINVGHVSVDTYAAIVNGVKYATWTAATNTPLSDGGVFLAYDDGTVEVAAGTATVSNNTHTVSVVTPTPHYHIVDNSDSTYTVTIDQHTVTFVDDDGTTVLKAATAYDYGTLAANVATPADTPTKDSTAEYSYTFAGWSPAVADVTSNATYTATYTPTKRSYTITWLNDDDSLIDTTTVEYGVVPTHADATKAATAEWTYTFAGWDTTPEAVTGTATYKATFNSTKNSYTITWLNDDDSLIDTTTVEYGVVPTHSAPTKAATDQYTYTFAGWTPTVVAVTGATSYKATYTPATREYTITWVVDGVSTTSQVAYGATPAYDGTPAKAEDAQYTYTFSGWDPAIVAVAGTATYTAQFTPVAKAATVISIALATNAVDGVRNGSLAATAAANKTVTVSAKVGISGAGDYELTAEPNGTVAIAGGIATATFAASDWNSPVEWTLSADDAQLAGVTYAKAENAWFTASELGTPENLGFGADITTGIIPEASAEGETVRIQTRIEVSASGSDEDPENAGDARGGIAVVDGKYKAYTGTAWTTLFGATPIDGEVDLLMVADMAAAEPAMRYYIDGVALYTTNATPGAKVYAIPLKVSAGDTDQIKAIGFSSAESVKAPVVAEYDVSYVAALGNTAYTNATAAVDALAAADKAVANDVTFTLLAHNVGGTVALGVGDAVTVANEATYTNGPSFTAPASYKVVKTDSTYSVELDAATILFISADGTYTNELLVALGETPVYAGPAQYTNDYADATGIYTFIGWTPAITAATGDAEYTANYTSVPSVASVNGEYYASLQAALDAIATANPYEAVITLNSAASITISKNGNVLGGSNTTNITINGNANTLNVIRNGTWAQFNTANDAKLVLNNVALTSEFTGTATGWTAEPLQNPNHNIAFNCNVELNDVTSDNALSFWKDAALDTVVISETNNVYPIWIHTTASNISIDGLVVNNSQGRGIKVDDAYVANRDGGAPSASTTISINNSTFDTTIARKSAVLVSSAYPVAVTAADNDISNVPADTTTLVWVDEAARKNYGLVTLNGAQPGIEGGTSSYAASYSEDGAWIDGYYKLLADAVAVADADDTVTLQKDVAETFAVAKELTITRNGFSAANVTADEGYVLTVTDSVYEFSAAPVIALVPASLELYPNCSNYVQVVGAPADSTYTYKFAGQVGCDSYLLNPPGWSKTEGWAWPYGKQPGGTGTITVTVSNNNAQVAQLVANVTVKDVAAVVDGVEYTSAQFADVFSAAKSGDKLIEVYYYLTTWGKISLAEGESIRWKSADNRGKGNISTLAVTVPETTDAAWYKAVASKDNATGITTMTCENQGVPYVKIIDGSTVTYSTTSFPTMSKAGATYQLLRDMAGQSGGVANKAGLILDLNGKTLGLTTGIKVSAPTTAASLTIRDTSAAGTGEISGGSSSSPLVWALNGDAVTIESGTFTAVGVAVYTEGGGTAAISGGTFSTSNGDASTLLNCKDDNRGTITVTGGSFNGFDPATSNAADGDMVASGYVSVADDPSAGWYTVHPLATVIWVVENVETTNTVAIGTATASIQPADPTKESTDSAAYTFANWAPAPDATVTSNATYTAVFDEISLAAATWIGGAAGDWEDASNWDIGYVPTKATVVTFTNDAQVAIATSYMKEMVVNADIVFTPASSADAASLHFSGNAGSAVSGSGTLGVDYLSLFNDNTAGALTIAADLDILRDVSFKGNKDNAGDAGSWTVTGDTTIADGVTVKCIDDATTTFQGDIDIASGAQVTFLAGYGTGSHGASIVVGSDATVTLAHNAGSPATKLTLDTTTANPNGTITISGQVVTDDDAYTVKHESNTYEAVLKTFTVLFTWNGGSSEATYTYGTAKADVTVPADPASYVDNGTIYTFTGWSAEVPDTITADVTITAQYSSAAAVATVITIADAGATTNTVGSYATLAEAVAAAPDGSTVVLLADVTLDARVEPNLGANTELTIDLGGHTITRTGTSGNGSAFDVKSGSVTIRNGTIDCTQDDTAIVANGVYAITSRSGSDVTLADLAITVDSECGACAYPFAGSTMTIESGTYANVTTTPYRYNTAITGMAVNQPNNATQNLIIRGGSFSQYDPQLGDDSGAMTDFTDDGFVAIDDGNGNFVVQPGYNVTFDANGGDPAPEAQRVAAGGKAAAPAAPAKDNYAFRAWQLGGVDYDFATVLTSDITLVAAYDGAKATVISVAGTTTNYYGTLAAAVAAAGNGEKVVLIADVNEEVVNNNANAFTIDLNGHTWSSDSDVLATTAGTITIEATNGGTMTTEAAQCCAVWAKGGDVVINGGTFTSKDNEEATIYVSNANSEITINGGTFQNIDTRPYRWKSSLQALTLNVKNDLEGQHLIINGGTFYGNDPQLGDDTAGGTSAQSSVKFVSDGYVAIEEGGVFVVQPGYIVTFDANGGSPDPAEQRVAATGTASAPDPAPTKEGCNFDGWFEDGAGAAYDFSTVLTNDLALTAHWSDAGFAENDTVAGVAHITADQAQWLNDFVASNDYTKATLEAALQTGWENKYLLNVNPVTGSGTITITSITVSGSSVTVTVELDRTNPVSDGIKGVLKLYGTSTLGTAMDLVDEASFGDADFSENNTTSATFSGVEEKFFRAKIVAPAPEAQDPPQD